MTAPNQPSSSPVETATAETGASTAGTDNASPEVNVGVPDIHAPGMPPGGATQTAPNRVMVRRSSKPQGDGPPTPTVPESDVAPNRIVVSRAGSPAAGHDTDPVTNPSMVGGPGPAEYPAAGEAPSKKANRDEWEHYARSSGASADEVKGMTKDQLIDTYGSA